MATPRNMHCPHWGFGIVCCMACYNSHGPCVDGGNCELCHTRPEEEGDEGLTFCTCADCLAFRSEGAAPR